MLRILFDRGPVLQHVQSFAVLRADIFPTLPLSLRRQLIATSLSPVTRLSPDQPVHPQQLATAEPRCEVYFLNGLAGILRAKPFSEPNRPGFKKAGQRRRRRLRVSNLADTRCAGETSGVRRVLGRPLLQRLLRPKQAAEKPHLSMFRGGQLWPITRSIPPAWQFPSSPEYRCRWSR